MCIVQLFSVNLYKALRDKTKFEWIGLMKNSTKQIETIKRSISFTKGEIKEIKNLYFANYK